MNEWFYIQATNINNDKKQFVLVLVIDILLIDHSIL